MIKIAAIDIGSNAIRFQVDRILTHNGNTEFKRLEYIRFPLRLGHDVFTTGRISEDIKEKFLKLLHSFKLLIDLYEVSVVKACATSAMREAENGQHIAKLAEQAYDFPIEIIDGAQEAILINKAIKPYIDESMYLHIDVGGGSTELSILKNRERILSESFMIGSVRSLKQVYSASIWETMKRWVKVNVHRKYPGIKGIGTGGNINKIYNLTGKKLSKKISVNTINATINEIGRYSEEDRINILKLNPDRADVIIPAAKIYLSVMEYAGINTIMVPEVGLKDGLIYSIYEDLTRQKVL
jgi:exopolyphosphatase/guanosine-5'-triphosphate,3'-diphosphate pyrophosphatase